MHRLRLKDQAFEDKNALVARWFFFCLGHVPTVPALSTVVVRVPTRLRIDIHSTTRRRNKVAPRKKPLPT